VIGVSNDDVASHKDFCTSEALPFPLLADTDKRVARAFGVGDTLGFYHRITFLVDRDGIVRRVFDPVRPAGHAREVLAALQTLSAARADGGAPAAPAPR
jgi:peroxiredoxin Q/BCP